MFLFSLYVMSNSLLLHTCQALLSSTISWSLLKFMSVSQRCYLNTAAPFSFCVQSFPASGSFPRSWLFSSGGQSTGASASASILPMNIQPKVESYIILMSIMHLKIWIYNISFNDLPHCWTFALPSLVFPTQNSVSTDRPLWLLLFFLLVCQDKFLKERLGQAIWSFTVSLK